jgi:ribosome-binding factor A
MRALRGAAGFLRSEVGKRIRLRTTPLLTFHLDHSMAHAEEIQRALKDLAPELAATAARDAAEAAAAGDVASDEGDTAARRSR